MRTVKAITNTWLKKHWAKQSSQLAEHEKVSVSKGSTYTGSLQEFEEDHLTNGFSEQHGHFKLELSHGAGTWYLYGEHWQFVDTDVIAPDSGYAVPKGWQEVNWQSMSSPVSKYFTVGEVALNQQARLPTDDSIKQAIFSMAERMDEIREWWGHPLGINSWYRPWPINRAIGSRAPNHPEGTGVDFRPLAGGTVHDLQTRFKREWYDTGKWQGGFGLGARKGFIHLDLRGRRLWNY